MFVVLLLLIVISGLVSGSEAAFFSLSPAHIQKLRERNTTTDQRVLSLLSDSKRLLATILIVNNFVNVSIVMLSAVISNSLIDFGQSTTLKFIFETIIITSLILFFGEIMPKIFSRQHSYKFTTALAYPLKVAVAIVSPFSRLLMKSTSLVNNRFARHQPNVSLDDLSQALELTSSEITEEKEMLEGIVKFTNLCASDIMTPRLDVVSIDVSASFTKVLQVVVDSGYSRIPVHSERLDDIRGILYVKDILPFIDADASFDWTGVLRKAYYVPETKKINDLLAEFQSSKTHMAVVVDEYGGLSGIVTLEDILEEIVGEIADELDDEERQWHRQADGSIIFEAKISLNDFFKVIDSDGDEFEAARGEAETLAGLLLEINGLIPHKQDVIRYREYTFEVLAADQRKIKKVRFCVAKTPQTKKK